MDIKGTLKRLVPKTLHFAYNRLVSRRKIQRRLGDWFEIDWKEKASSLDDRSWVEVYNRSWENCSASDLSEEDLLRIREKVEKCDTLLDAGCGDGKLLENLADLARFRCGVDLSGTGLRQARERLREGTLLTQAFLEKLPFRDHAFEVVICAHTLEHVKDLTSAVKELKRVARHRLIILAPSQEYLPYTEDYHLHYFSKESDLINLIGIENAVCEKYTILPGVCAYSGDVLLFTGYL